VVPPLVGTAVKETLVVAQIVLPGLALMITDGTVLGVMVTTALPVILLVQAGVAVDVATTVYVPATV
jgi:hypothetical protein